MDVRRDVFQAIADPSRRAILTLLAAGALSPGVIANHFDSTRQTISRHIQILVECGLVTSESTGREVYYQLNRDKLTDVLDFLEPFRQQWENRFRNMDTLITKSRKK